MAILPSTIGWRAANCSSANSNSCPSPWRFSATTTAWRRMLAYRASARLTKSTAARLTGTCKVGLALGVCGMTCQREARKKSKADPSVARCGERVGMTAAGGWAFEREKGGAGSIREKKKRGVKTRVPHTKGAITQLPERLFSTIPQFMHSFAQGFCQNFIDAKNRKIYLAPQIEPEAWT